VLKRFLIGSVLCVVFSYANASAQGICPLGGTSSGKLVCVIPQTFGPFGLGTGAGAPLLTNRHQGHFESDFLSSFGPINEAVGVQVSQLPIASPSSGITFRYDPSLKTFAPSKEESLGPILGERASTIGRNKLYLAFSFQYFNFSSVDGQDTGKLPAVFQHQAISQPFPPGVVQCGNPTGLTGTFAGQPCFVRDYIQTVNSIDLTVHQYTVYATYGLTRHLDFSIEIPFLDVHLKNTSNATIVPNSVAPTSAFPTGVFHEFSGATVPGCASTTPCLNASFSNSGSAGGIGDVTLRGKYELYQGERFGVAAGLDVRLPTGDEQNFLGSGATGVKPFGVISYSARVSPHAELGYEWNGKSILAGDFVGPTATNAKGSLPNRFVYTVGADVSIVKRLTGAFDLFGQRLFNSTQLFSNPYTDLGKCSDVNCTSLTAGTTHPNLGVHLGADYNIVNASVGLKYQAIHKLVLTGNVLFKLNDNGLRATAVPLVGVSYNF
jgi:outer membrane putative beta-barrel porin/alpha-amylase